MWTKGEVVQLSRSIFCQQPAHSCRKGTADMDESHSRKLNTSKGQGRPGSGRPTRLPSRAQESILDVDWSDDQRAKYERAGLVIKGCQAKAEA